MASTFSAPAKVILSGEHAVVYGRPALVTSIDRRVTCTIIPTRKRVSGQPYVKVFEKIVTHYLKTIHVTPIKSEYRLRVHTQVPTKRNLGSSAALSAAVCASFLHFLSGGKEFSKDVINSLAYKGEKYFHGNPSGVDNSASVYGGLIYYRKEFEFLKSLSLLPGILPKVIESRLYLIDSGKPQESTKTLLAHVGRQYNKDSKKTEHIMWEIEKITKKMTIAITGANIELFTQAVRQNEERLEELDLVSERTKKLFESLTPFGSGKITGAGGRVSGSGYILFVADDPKSFEKYLHKSKIKYLPFLQGSTGVRKENSQ